MGLCINRWCSLGVLIINCMCYFKCYTCVKADKLGKHIHLHHGFYTFVQLMPMYDSKWIIWRQLFKFSIGYQFLQLLQHCSPPRPKMPLGHVVYICYENSLAKGQMRKMWFLTNLNATDCCQITTNKKLIYFPTNSCKLQKNLGSLKIQYLKSTQLGKIHALLQDVLFQYR